VAEALALYDAETLPYRLDTRAIFHRNVKRLGMAQDAVHELLEDPKRADRYYLGPRSDEVEIVYLDFADRNQYGEPRRKRDTLQALLQRIEAPATVGAVKVHEKYADPRKLLTDYSDGLRGELTLFLQAMWQEEERQAKLAAASPEEEAADLQGVFDTHVLPTAVDDLAWAMGGLLDEETAAQVAAYAAPRYIQRVIERIREAEGEAGET